MLKQKAEDLIIKPGKAGKVTLSHANKLLTVQGMKTEDFPVVPKIKFKKINQQKTVGITGKCILIYYIG